MSWRRCRAFQCARSHTFLVEADTPYHIHHNQYTYEFSYTFRRLLLNVKITSNASSNWLTWWLVLVCVYTCYRGRYQAATVRSVGRRGAGLRRTRPDSTPDGNHTTTTSSHTTRHRCVSRQLSNCLTCKFSKQLSTNYSAVSHDTVRFVSYILALLHVGGG